MPLPWWRAAAYALIFVAGAAGATLAAGIVSRPASEAAAFPSSFASVWYGLAFGVILGLAAVIVAAIERRARRAEAEARRLRGEIERLRVDGQQLVSAREELERRLDARAAELAGANRELRAEIDERTRCEITLRASVHQYRELFDNAYDLIYEHDLEGRFLAINRAAQRITGYDQREALGMNIEQLLAPEDVELVRSRIVRQLAGEPASTYLVSVTTKAGTPLALELSTHLVFHRGIPVAVQGIARDVTERRRLEDQLRQSQKMEAIGRLAGGLAHDFNNLLTVIGAYSQMILDETAGHPELEGFAAEVLAATERAGALTARLLTFSRRQMLAPQILNLNQIVMSMDNMLRRLLGEDIELRTVLDAAIGTIKADPGQIEQVIMNLAVNARDAMPCGGRLTIETAPAEFGLNSPPGLEPRPYVKLVVSDTGVGMSADIANHIFEPFFTTKGPGKGTGLGLSTVYGIVKQSGGEIVVETEPGRGTTFCIYLARCGETTPAEAAGQAAGGAEPRPRERATILLIEDEPGVRRLVRRMLVERGYRVLEASGGEEALATFEKHHPIVDLVLTDVVMPNMSGIEVARRLKALRPELKTLYMTGYSEDILFERGGVEAGAPVLRKPFLAEALERRVRELLDART
ncbi:MAG TPA: PAS domain S-box protein [Bryobacteraceae bacterium]|nr:PAS domain S-box protein [Bryobacteraceae bacterium]